MVFVNTTLKRDVYLEETMTRSMYHRVILFTCLEYIDKQLQSDETYRGAELKVILERLKAFKSFRKFSSKEAQELAKLGEKEAFQNVKKVEVDFSIYSLALLYEWIQMTPKKERPQLMISDSKITSLYSGLVMDMIRLKQRGKNYDSVKEIVDASKLTAKRFINLLDNEVKDES